MLTSPLLPHHERAGARLVPAGPGATPLTFGDVPAEYRAGLEGAALFDATCRGAVRVGGGERLEFLHRLLANRVRNLAPGEGDANLLLTSKGKVAHAFDLEVDAEEVRLSTPPPPPGAPAETAAARDLLAALDRYHFTEDVELADASEETAPLELCGPEARAVVTAVVGDPGDLALHAFRHVSRGDLRVRVGRVPVAGSEGYRLDGGPAAAPALWDALVAAGARPAGVVAHDSLRVEAGSAAFGVDVDDNVYPQEARLEDAFDLEKGCYIGQEVVAKIDTYGGLNKRLVALHVDGDDPVPRGTPLVGDDGRELGLVTSWAYSFVLDGGLCLGYAKRRHQEPGTTFRLGEDGPRATVVEAPVRPGAAGPGSA